VRSSPSPSTRSLYETQYKNLEEGVRTGSSPVRQTCRWQPKVLAVEIATRLKKELLAQSLSCTQVSRTLGHALSVTRSSLTVVEVICMIRGGGWSSGPMMMKPRAKGVLGRISSAKGNTKW
jgi:hypothetical protein